jgi:hypothetical protein
VLPREKLIKGRVLVIIKEVNKVGREKKLAG